MISGRDNKTYYHCTSCCKIAGPSCAANHRHRIEKIFGTEIQNLPIRRRFECQECKKIGFSSDPRYKCTFCLSFNTKEC